MKTYTEITINKKMYWYRIYGSRAGQTLEIKTPTDLHQNYQSFTMPYNDILLPKNETMENFVKKIIKTEKL